MKLGRMPTPRLKDSKFKAELCHSYWKICRDLKPEHSARPEQMKKFFEISRLAAVVQAFDLMTGHVVSTH